jgi:hypothetical protein
MLKYSIFRAHPLNRRTTRPDQGTTVPGGETIARMHHEYPSTNELQDPLAQGNHHSAESGDQ